MKSLLHQYRDLLETSRVDFDDPPSGFARKDNLVFRVFNRATIALLVLMLGTNHLLGQESLEQYDEQYRNVTVELEQFTKTLARRMQIQANNGGGGIAEEDRVKLRELQDAQTGYLEKLISLAPDNQGYRLDLAKLAAAKGDKELAISILKELAPLDDAGYAPAHLILAQFYFDSKAANGFEQQQSNLSTALQHVDRVLTDDKSNVTAKLLKAKILVSLEKYEGAYQLYDDLLEANPNYFRQMLELNKRLGREEHDQQVCEKALASFENLAEKEENQTDDRRWIVIESGFAAVLQKLGRYEDAESRLNKMIEVYSADPKGGPRSVFLKRLLSGTYVAWANEVADPQTAYDSLSADASAKLLDLLTKAYRNNPDNVLALQSIARLSQSSNAEIADKAKAVYDATADPNAPAPVLNQLGNHALLDEDFSEAIRYYELAREKMPRDPAILNNLAYAYLVAGEDKRDGKRALELVSAAIRILPDSLPPVEMSKFLHTKATALKELGRTEEAIVVYETSLKPRPNDTDTLESLIECYQELNKQPPEDYAARLKKLSE